MPGFTASRWKKGEWSANCRWPATSSVTLSRQTLRNCPVGIRSLLETRARGQRRFLDFIPMADDRLGVVVADVSDKGMPAAMFMALSRSVIRSVVGQDDDLSREIGKVNQLVWRDSSEGAFITLFFAQFKASDNVIKYVNAGHNPPMVFHARDKKFEYLSRTGMAAGVEGDTVYQQGVVNLDDDDFVLMYTDGVTDAQIGKSNFGAERLMKAALDNSALSAKQW